MKRWRADDSHPMPVQIECENRGYPHADADGQTQYENTHFDSEDEAWEKCRESAEAYVVLTARSVRQAEEQLANAREDAAKAVKFMKAYIDGRDAVPKPKRRG